MSELLDIAVYIEALEARVLNARLECVRVAGLILLRAVNRQSVTQREEAPRDYGGWGSA